MSSERLQELSDLGQSVWVDFVSRDSLRDGSLAKLIAERSVVGVTSNPTIFQQAMSDGGAYDAQLAELVRDDDRTVFWKMAERDITDALELFRPVYDRTEGNDGYVSLEVDPHLAYDTMRTYDAAIELHKTIDRPNLMVKIPATLPGLAAIEDVIASGHSINVTLIFSLQRYAAVSESYIRGLERLAARGGDVSKVASVASFFVSRIDTETDRRIQEAGAPAELAGRLAIANARLAYEQFLWTFTGPRWEELEARGARPQRLLWASTSTKNPDYRDVVYVEELIGPETVNTMPLATIEAFADHGVAEPRLVDGLEEANALMSELAEAGIDYKAITDTLEREGVDKFAASFDELIEALSAKRAGAAV